MSLFDALVIALYAAAVLAIGAAVTRRDAGGEDYLLGSRRIPAWAALCSLIATELSAATFIGVPNDAFVNLGWTYLQFGIGSLLARLVLARVVIPLYHRERVRTVYEFIGTRYGEGARLATAWTFLGGRLIAASVRLFIAGFAFAHVIGAGSELAIIGCGIVAAVYSTSGGIRAVIWTDVLQGAILLAGAVAALATIHGAMPGGLPAALDWAREEGAMRWLSFPRPEPAGESASAAEWALLLLRTPNAFITALAGGFFLTLATHSTDHDMVQRLLTTQSGRKGGIALAASGLVNFPVVALFLLLGTGLAALRAAGVFHPEGTDQVFPQFVSEWMAPPWRGLLLAGLFAATMSSLDSTMCALSATWAVDIRGSGGRARDGAPAGDGSLERASRLGTAVFAGLLVLFALGFAEYRERHAGEQTSLVQFALSAMTVVYGALLAVFVFGFLVRRGSSTGAVIALAAGSATGAALFLQKFWLGETRIAWPWWVPISAAVSFAIVSAFPYTPREGAAGAAPR